ncbi:hypothetical protein L484_014751 [Morus notabilis]|uniref:Methyltransferase-related protein n=1 Tax=Morus notabilis TaxID=981085 RepID=W9QPI9_9ROSA|nr:hypothetical protein L484_014751 [Morus notabilis]
MCPMRFILVFFSAVLAGYFAWKTARSPSPGIYEDSTNENIAPREEKESDLKRMVQNGFWVFVDMASGRYLWRNLKGMENREEENVKSS